MQFTTLSVPGSEALTILDTLRRQFAQTGEYPFIIGDAEQLERIQGAQEFHDEDFDDLLKKSEMLNIVTWIRQRREESEEFEFSEEETLGEWPGEILVNDAPLLPSLHFNLQGEPLDKVYIGLAEIPESWQLPAALSYGGWNACPMPEEHCAFHRRWQLEYGAEIVGMSFDSIECFVKNPPRDQQQAIALAWQQFWYCEDIVYQGIGSVAELAAALINANYWQFWWD